jgi:hypothetical protein
MKLKLPNLVSLSVDRDTGYGTTPEDVDGVCLMTDQRTMNLIGLEGHGAVERNGWKGWKVVIFGGGRSVEEYGTRGSGCPRNGPPRSQPCMSRR